MRKEDRAYQLKVQIHIKAQKKTADKKAASPLLIGNGLQTPQYQSDTKVCNILVL